MKNLKTTHSEETESLVDDLLEKYITLTKKDEE